MISVKEFLINRKIKHLHIKYKVNENGKKELDEANSKGCKELLRSYTTLMGLNSQRIEGYTTMGINTDVFNQIDVDDKDLFDKYFGELELDTKTPYYLSVEKKLPHYLVRFSNIPKNKNGNNKTKAQIKNNKDVIADILTGFWGWCPINGELINSELEPIELDYNKLIKLAEEIPTSDKVEKTNKKEKVEKIDLKRKLLDEEINFDFDEEDKEVRINRIDDLLLDLLTKEVSDDRTTWFNTGRIIYDLYQKNHEQGLKRFHKFSMLSNKYNKEEIDKQYYEFKDSRQELTMGSVVEYLKTKSPIRHKMYQKTVDSLYYTYTDGDYAQRFHKLFKDRYICAGFKPCDYWFEYSNGIYEELNSSAQIEELIKEQVLIVRENYCEITKTMKYYEMLERRTDTKDPDLTKYVSNVKFYRELSDKMYDAYVYCDSAGGQSKIYKCAKVMFYDKELLKKLNKNINLLGFSNNLFDLNKIQQLRELIKDKEITNDELTKLVKDNIDSIFRESTKEDYISVKTGMTKEECLEVKTTKAEKYLKSVFPTEGQYEYMLTLLSDSIYGKNRQRFCVNMGIGKNSKSLLQSLMKRAFGGYFGTMSPSFITAKDDENCGSANSELYACRYARSLWISEPPENKSLNGSRMKILAGNDLMKIREIYKIAEDFTPQFSIYINCNTTFKLESCSDISLPRRIKFNPFTQFFASPKDYDPKNKSHSLENDKLLEEDYLVKLSRSLMRLLLEHYVKIDLLDKTHDVEAMEPKLCKDTKKLFIETGDSFQEFFDQGYELMKEDRTKFVSVNMFYTDYVNYCRNNQYKPLNKNNFIGKMQMLFPNPKRYYFPKSASITIDGKKEYYSNICKGIRERDIGEIEVVEDDTDSEDEEEVVKVEVPKPKVKIIKSLASKPKKNCFDSDEEEGDD